MDKDSTFVGKYKYNDQNEIKGVVIIKRDYTNQLIWIIIHVILSKQYVLMM